MRITPIVFTFFILTSFISPIWAADSDSGKKIFEQVCTHCHAVDGEQKFAPNLRGIGERRDAQWLDAWLKDPSELLKHDRYAQALLGKNQYGIHMPKIPSMQDEQKRADVIAYLLTAF